ncbi:hypothetical protein V1478_005987 [Vespula squamosa]|uniref:Secreted protein n=1 Tax=Vespula squamosa TaxID=30214 RepID=A0ABD2B9H1_VESSQ
MIGLEGISEQRSLLACLLACLRVGCISLTKRPTHFEATTVLGREAKSQSIEPPLFVRGSTLIPICRSDWVDVSTSDFLFIIQWTMAIGRERVKGDTREYSKKAILICPTIRTTFVLVCMICEGTVLRVVDVAYHLCPTQ